MSREEDLIVRDMLTHNVSMEIVCVCGESLSGADVDHQGTVRGFAQEAFDLGWRPDGSDSICPECMADAQRNWGRDTEVPKC